VADDPYAPLLGEREATASQSPYTISITGADSLSISDLGKPQWKREGNELHGDWLLRTTHGLSRAHAEVLLRPVGALVQRSLLVVLFDLLIVAILWAMSALADGGYARWISVRRRRWARSYRSRLTVVLFAFFVLPAAAFAIWSYRQLRSDDLQSRELLLREYLRGVASGGNLSDLAGESARIDAPLLLYERGELRSVSDTLYDALAPFGRFVAPEVFVQLGVSDEVTASRSLGVGKTQALLGYRTVTDERGQRTILAAPARVGEETLDQRRRDLGILVLFTTALGGLAALGLSGVAAKQFARPIGELRDAALTIASGAREPGLGTRPPAEFLPVYSAFRRMAADLGASREALLEARRRTEAVLRTVASGVVAIDADAVVTLANPRAETLLGRSLAPGDHLDGKGSAEIAERVRRFLRSRQDDVAFEAEVGRRQLRGRLTRLVPGNGAVLTLDDVTELGQAQRILAWGEMARQVAHEIKNPLTPIRLGVQHLRRAFAGGRADFPQVLEQNAARILAEIDRLDEIARSFSRYGTPPTEHPPAELVNVTPVLQRIVELERMGEDRAIEWILDGADAPVTAMAHEGELRDVLLNLAENARLAGAGRVRIAVERNDGEVRISVADDGEGIPTDVLPRIFEPHFSTRTSGSGLGLAVSRRLVDGWGGTISVDSERGRGTVVRVVLRAAGT
jgi:signal transduction histidine kinase